MERRSVISMTWVAGLLGCPLPTEPSADEVGVTSNSDVDDPDSESTGSSTTSELDTGLDTDSETDAATQEESSSETNSGTDTGDEGPVHHPPGESPACTVMPGDHSSVCAEGDPCPIVDDVDIWCDGYGIQGDASGITIDAERVITIAESTTGGWLFTVQGEGAEVIALPDVLDNAEMRLTGDQDAAPHMLATSGRQHFYVLPDANGFLLESITAPTPDDDYTRPYAIAIDSLERPHVWVRQEPGVDHGIRERGWTIGPTGSTSFDRTAFGLDRLDRPVELIEIVTAPMVQLATRIDGVDRPFGDPIEGEGLRAVLGQTIRPSELDLGDIDYALAYQPWLLHAIWPVGESAWQAVEIAEAVPNLNPCLDECPCEPECTDDVGGVARFRLAQTSGDELWLAWTNDYDNTVYVGGEAWGDTPTSSFHLARIDTTTGSYEIVLDLTLPSWVVALDIHAHDRRLGVRMHTRDTIQDGQTRRLRVLGLDLDGF